MVVARLQMILRAGRERRDVIRRVTVRRLNLNPHFGRGPGRDFFHPFDGRLVARHGVVRKQGNQQNLVNLLLRQPAHRFPN